MGLKSFVFLLVVLVSIINPSKIYLAIADDKPIWKPEMRQDKFLNSSEKEIIRNVGRKIGGFEEEVFIAAYAEYKISRQIAGGNHEQAIKNFKTYKQIEILFRKRSLFKGTVFDSHTRQSDFLGIKQGLFNRKAPDLFYDFLDACKRAWVAKIKKEDER